MHPLFYQPSWCSDHLIPADVPGYMQAKRKVQKMTITSAAGFHVTSLSSVCCSGTSSSPIRWYPAPSWASSPTFHLQRWRSGVSEVQPWRQWPKNQTWRWSWRAEWTSHQEQDTTVANKDFISSVQPQENHGGKWKPSIERQRLKLTGGMWHWRTPGVRTAFFWINWSWSCGLHSHSFSWQQLVWQGFILGWQLPPYPTPVDQPLALTILCMLIFHFIRSSFKKNQYLILSMLGKIVSSRLGISRMLQT